MAHAARAERTQNLVKAELLTWGNGHVTAPRLNESDSERLHEDERQINWRQRNFR